MIVRERNFDHGSNTGNTVQAAVYGNAAAPGSLQQGLCRTVLMPLMTATAAVIVAAVLRCALALVYDHTIAYECTCCFNCSISSSVSGLIVLVAAV
jgi:hypothetical protein